MTARSPEARALEQLRIALDAAFTAVIACEVAGADGDIKMLKLSLEDDIGDVAFLIAEQSERDDEHDPEVIADREADERHERGLRAWHYGRTV